MKGSDYILVSEGNAVELVEAVNDALADGYKLVGGPFITAGHVFVQAMVK